MRYFSILLLSIMLVGQSFGQATGISKTIKIKKGQRYLNFPVDPKVPVVTAGILLDGKLLDQFTISLSDRPEFWTYFDVSLYAGKTLTVNIEKNTSEYEKALSMIFSDDAYPGQDSVYQEKNRPQVHFTAQRGWLNDPNGLIYRDGEYHLYFQHNPYGWPWGNMHWGHAVSSDLLHWTQLQEAIYPVLTPGVINDAAFSGSAIVDLENTAGFRKNGIDPIIAFYTSTARGECIQLSYDKGRTFINYENNPVVKHAGEGRDPKVFWYEPGKHWVMVVWVAGRPRALSNGEQTLVREHSIFTSPDLKHWTYQSGVAGFFECPDLFELGVEGKPDVKKWVMYDATGKYIVGDFDGKKFNIEQHFTQYEHGGGYFYAAQTYNHAPNNRRIQIGWGRDISHPGMPFNQAMLFPTDLTLKMTEHGYRLCPTPLKEISTLHKNTQVIENRMVTKNNSVRVTANRDAAMHVVAEFERGNAPIVVKIFGYEIRFDNEWMLATIPPEGSEQRSIQEPVTYASTSPIFKLEAIVDKNILEIFINDGEVYYVTPLSTMQNGSIEVIADEDANR
jgi:fructan beta-fructosidase